VTFDIPEVRRKDRQTLWRALRNRRLGLLQQSVWIWPHDIQPILNEIIGRRDPRVRCRLECARLLLCTDSEVVGAAWDFTEIIRAQETYLQNIGKRMNALRRAADLKTLARGAKEERQSYIAAFALDPMLPQELLPRGIGVHLFTPVIATCVRYCGRLRRLT